MKNKVIKKIAAAGAALMMAVTGMAMSVNADDIYYQTMTPLFYAPYTYPIHTSDYKYITARNSGPTVYVNTTLTIIGTGQMNVSALYANNDLVLYASGNYPIYFSASAFPKGTSKRFDYSLSNYGTYSTINATGAISN